MEINAGSTGESKTAATPVRFKSEAQQTENLKTPGAQLELMQCERNSSFQQQR